MTPTTCRECDLLTSPNGPEDSDDVQCPLLQFHDEALAGKVGFYAPSPGLILEHFRVERAEPDTA